MRPPASSCSIRASCDVLPSEDPETVARALEYVLDGAGAAHGQGTAVASSESAASLLRIRSIIQSRASARAWRRRLRLNTEENSTWVYLNKQAAAAGVIALCSEPDESPLGPITLSLRSSELGGIIDWLAPRPEE